MTLPKAKRDDYRGSDSSKKAAAREHNSYASEINQAIERLYAQQSPGGKTYDYLEIAREARIDENIVEKIGLDNGSLNGMTLYKPSKEGD